jgi:phosphocarrier protein FPr
MESGIELVIRNRTGLHARPAKEFVNLAKKFAADIRVHHGGRKANGKSLVSLLTLGVKSGSAIRIEAQGADSEEALRALSDAIAGGLGEGVADGPEAAAQPTASVRPDPSTGSGEGRTVEPAAVAAAPSDPRLRRGLPAAPGLALGPVHQLRAPAAAPLPGGVGTPIEERARLESALAAARDELTAVRDRLQERLAQGGAAEVGIFEVHAEILEDPDLVSVALARIADGENAAAAWKAVLEVRAASVSQLEDALLAARAADLGDVAERVLRILAGGAAAPELPAHPVVIVAPELSPSQTSSFEPGRVLGICTAAGGPTSHAAILARALGLPSVVGAGPGVLEWPEGTPVILDGDAGTVLRDPGPAEQARAADDLALRAERLRAAVREAFEPAVTRDGHRVEVVANVGGAAEARQAAEAGAEGVGLLRTEFLFLGRSVPPTEEEQREVYAQVAAALGGKPVIVRTLDVGGDKPLAYLPMPAEANPFLGVRGLRLCLSRPDLFREQLRAIVRASSAGRLRIMFPMVADVSELRAARAILREVAEGLGAPPLEVGIMVEIPAAALLADALAAEVDFFSIGSNDLTQYTLAMDRGHPTLAAQADGLHPAVLRLVERTVDGAHRAGKWVGLCGELGADPVAVPILVGLGLDELSVNVPALATVKARIRSLSFEEARRVAARALSCSTAAEVREKAIVS